MAKIVSVRRGLWEELFIPELVRGLTITLRHFLSNTLFRKWQNNIVTVRYPEEKRLYPERFRGVHRLMYRQDGTLRCVACMMCSTICPANCIHIEAGELDSSNSAEKYPIRFDIDELVCVVCGMCVEACPCDAIRMDSGIHMIPVERRSEALLSREALRKMGTQNIAIQGGAGPNWKEKYKDIGPIRAIFDKQQKYNKSIQGS
jgi:NADH-quinone oxidoreductase subunit I